MFCYLVSVTVFLAVLAQVAPSPAGGYAPPGWTLQSFRNSLKKPAAVSVPAARSFAFDPAVDHVSENTPLRQRDVDTQCQRKTENPQSEAVYDRNNPDSVCQLLTCTGNAVFSMVPKDNTPCGYKLDKRICYKGQCLKRQDVDALRA